MIPRELVVGQQISNIVGDSSLSGADFNFTDFIYVLANGIAFRMPYDDESGDLLRQVAVSKNHAPLKWPPEMGNHFNDHLRVATIADILVPQNPEERFPDTGLIKLSSGWFLGQLGGAPCGISPSVNIQKDVGHSDPVISVWAATQE